MPLSHFLNKGEVDMKSRISALLVCLILAAFTYVNTAAAQGLSPSNAAPIGMSIKTRVECGERAGSMEPYDATIAVLQVLRGKEALDRIKNANPASQPPSLRSVRPRRNCIGKCGQANLPKAGLFCWSKKQTKSP
jgi:hypothetical protein